jgi:chitin synthase
MAHVHFFRTVPSSDAFIYQYFNGICILQSSRRFLVAKKCNVRGTKGSDEKAEEVPVVVSLENGISSAIVDLPVNQHEIDQHYTNFLTALSTPKNIGKKRQVSNVSQEDYFRLFRTRVVLFWIVSNAVLIGCMTVDQVSIHLGFVQDHDGNNINPFLVFIFWSVAFLSVFRLAGSLIYIISRKAS